MQLLTLGVNHHTAPLAIREQVAFGPEKLALALHELTQSQRASEVAILSMEAIVKRPVVVTIEGEDVITIRPMMNMTCSFDHRVLDGAQVGNFLADVRTRLEGWDPATPLV